MMRKTIGLFLVMGCLAVCSPAVSSDAPTPSMAVGDLFPAISLAPVSDADARAYLGVAENQYFTLQEVQAEVVLVEIMNTNCLSCKRQAAVLNEVYGMIAADGRARSKIKLLAIAVGNTDTEITAFKDSFQVPFPIIADPEYLAWDATGRSGTPLSILVRQHRDQKAGVVVGVHLGIQARAKALFDELLAAAEKAPPDIPSPGSPADARAPGEPAPLFSKQKIMELMVMSIFKAGIVSEGIETVALKKGGTVYVGKGVKDGRPVRVFMKPVVRFLPCDVCHDAQFFYIFREDGEIVDLVPMRLSKYGNQPFSETDTDKLRARFIGKRLFDPVVFNPAVDAVSAATITSSVVYKSFQEGRALYEELKAEGLLSQ